MEIIYSKKEFIKFCKKNNIKCTTDKNAFVKDCLVLELPSDVVCVGEYSNSMGVIYNVVQIENNVLIKGSEYPYKSGISYNTCYTFDNSDNQVLAVFGLWGGWNALVKSKDNQRDKIEHIMSWKFLNK